MSRAFIREDDGERSNAVSDIQHREAKVDWLMIQEKKLDNLLKASPSGKVTEKTLARWIKETRDDIARTRAELGYKD